jgi:hypothetical protein
MVGAIASQRLPRPHGLRGTADADRSAREPGARPRKSARTPINPRVLSWLGLWLASWLMLLSLCALAWIYLKRRFGPDARLVRAARAGSRKGEFRLEYRPVVSLRDGSAGKFEARPSALDDSTQQGARQIVHQLRQNWRHCPKHTTTWRPLMEEEL